MINGWPIRLIHWFCPTAHTPIETFICALIFSLAATQITGAQDDDWVVATGDWSVPTNWSLGTVPGTANNVVVDNGGTAVISTAGGMTSYTIQNLSIGATTGGSTVEINNGVTLGVAAITISSGGTLNLDSGASFSQSGGFTNNGNIIINSGFVNTGPIRGTGSVTKVSTLEVGWAAPLDAGAHVLVNDGTFLDESPSIGNATVSGATSVLGVDTGITLNTGPVLNNNGTLNNSGTVSGPTDGVISNTGGATVENQTGGVIRGGTRDAIHFNQGGTVVNNGQITATGFAGVFTDGSAGSVSNSGAISGNTAGVFLNAGGTVNNLAGGTINGNGNDGVFLSGGTGTVVNSGTITGPDGVRFQGPGVNSVTNNAGGLIQGIGGVGVGTLGAAVINVTNSGTITGGIGILLVNGGTITNHAGATISGTGGTAIQVAGAAANFSNTGNISGNVILGNFANSVTLLTGERITGNLDAGSPGAAALTLEGAGTQVLSQAVTGTIGGFFSLAKQGTGTWIIDEDLSHTGGTTIASGTLQIGNGGTTGSIVGSVVDNGILAFNRSNTVTFGGTISGTGSVAVNGFGTLALTGTNTYTGGTNLNDGILAVATDSNLGTGSINFNGGTLEILAAGGGIVSNKPINLGEVGGTLLADANTKSTFAGIISGFSGLVKDGAGEVILTAANTYTGGTTVVAGTLQLGDGGTSGSIVGNVVDNGNLTFNRSDAVTFEGIISGTGSIAQSGTGTTILTADSTYTGGTTIASGTLQIGNGGTTGSIVGPVVDNGTLAFNRSNAATFGGTISGAGSVVQSGTGTTILTADNTYTGGTTIASGTLQIGNGGITGSILGPVVDNGIFAFNRSNAATFGGTISGAGNVSQDGAGTVILTGDNSYSGGTAITRGTLQIGNGGTTGSISGNISNNGALIFNRGDALTFAGLISGSGTVAQNGSGTLILTGTNTYTGGTMINAGTIQLGNGGTTGSVAGNVIDNGTLIFNRSDSVTFDGVISGTGVVTESGGGTLVLNAANTYSGGTSINGGTIIAAVNDALGTGSVNVNDPSVLRINPGVSITNFVQVNNTGSFDNFGTVQAIQATRGPSAAVTTSKGATITNETGATISGIGINGIQSLNGSVTITNSGTISGIQGIQLGGDGTITNNPTGSITGLASVAILASAGQTTLSNSGTLNGNVTLSSSLNTVQLFTGSRINGNLDLGSNAGSTLIFDGGGTQTFSQAVTGTVNNGGSLTKQGSGTWIIDTILNAPISTKLLDGILEVNGSLRSSNVTVQPGATLSGVGNVVGNIFNFGTLSPGNSPGTLTVNGNFSQGPNGVLNVQFVSLQNYSRLAVTGHANLDGTLSLTLASGFRPPPGSKFAVPTAGQGISGTFRSISTNAPVKVTYESGLVDVVSASQPKPEIHLSDGTPVSTTALLADYTFYGFGSLAERAAQGLVETGGPEKNNAISLTFDAGEFDVQGHHGETYTIPIAGQFKINNRVRLDYEIPLQYIQVAGTGLFQAGVTLDLPTKVIIPSADQPWSWDVTPTAAIAASGGKEIIGGGALTNVIAYRWRGITATYGNYISFFKGNVLDTNDPKFSSAVDQQIMKNGLRLDIPFAKSWLVEGYGIYTQFFQSAAVGSYWTIGAEVGHHFTWKVENQILDLGYLSVGLYTEFGNRYSSGHFQLGSAWKF